MSLEEQIGEILDIPVIKPFQPVIPPCVTCYPVSESAGLTGDGEETEGVEAFQIDIWIRDKRTVKEYARKLKKEMTSRIPFMTVPDISYTFDNNGKMWRATIAFSIVVKE